MGYEHKDIGEESSSSRITAWSRLLKSVGALIWAIICLIVISCLGYYLVAKDRSSIWPAPGSGGSRPKSELVPQVYAELDKEVEQAIGRARRQAREQASRELDQWTAELRQRVPDFADWYFGYWGTQLRGAKALYDEVVHWIDSGQPTAAEKMTEEFQKQFAIRVLQPGTSQMRLERIQREALTTFLNNLKGHLDKIPEKYEISPADWDNYLAEISQQESGIEGGRNAPITLKVLYASAAGGTVVLASKALKLLKTGLGTSVGAKVSSKLAGKVGGKLATKTGGKVAAKFGGALVGEIVGVGIIIWDVWDHVTTVRENRPILINSINGYLDEMKRSLLDDPETGVMSPVLQVERQLRASLAVASKNRSSQ
jgi:hypothetical protein